MKIRSRSDGFSITELLLVLVVVFVLSAIGYFVAIRVHSKPASSLGTSGAATSVKTPNFWTPSL